MSRYCGWRRVDSPEESYWDTTCGNAFEFMADGPMENKFKYCPYCGSPIAISWASLPEGDPPDAL